MDEATTQIESDFRRALARLVSGEPTSPELVRMKAKLGYVRITPSSVAREAGHSRTNIGSKLCPYPDVRKAVLKYARTHRKRPSDGGQAGEADRSASYTQLVAKLSVADTLNATLILELDRERDRAEQAVRRIERLKGTLPTKFGVVVPIVKSEH